MINFSDQENLKKLIKIERSSLNSTLDIQKSLNKQILMFMKNFIGNLEISFDFNPSNTALDYINSSTENLTKSNANINALKKTIEKLDYINLILGRFPISAVEEKITEYNLQFTDTIETIYTNTSSIENFVHKIALLNLYDFLQECNTYTELKKEQLSNVPENLSISSEELGSTFVENTLIISEVQQKVILPFTITELKKQLEEHPKKFISLEDVIEKKYTRPINYYKFSSIARFKEAYNLVIKKEKQSKLKAFFLASELLANYNLHPAIITACNSLDELDIYLACLEDNTLEEFKFFNIKFEVPLAVTKNKSLEF